jgi:hypothetical protein
MFRVFVGAAAVAAAMRRTHARVARSMSVRNGDHPVNAEPAKARLSNVAER